MRTQAIDSLAAWPADLRAHRGVLVLSGYGLDVRVWRGRLRVADGIGHDRRQGLVHRATGGLRRLVVLGHAGSVSLDAIRWLSDVAAGYLQLDADGQVLAAFGPQGTDRPGLRRASPSSRCTRRRPRCTSLSAGMRSGSPRLAPRRRTGQLGRQSRSRLPGATPPTCRITGGCSERGARR